MAPSRPSSADRSRDDSFVYGDELDHLLDDEPDPDAALPSSTNVVSTVSTVSTVNTPLHPTPLTAPQPNQELPEQAEPQHPMPAVPLVTSQPQPAPVAKVFPHFPLPHAFTDMNTDMFRDAQGQPHHRFLPVLADESPGFCEPDKLFKAMLPMSHINTVVIPETSARLLAGGRIPLRQGEFMRYIGYRLAMTFFKTSHLNDYWSDVEAFLIPALNFESVRHFTRPI